MEEHTPEDESTSVEPDNNESTNALGDQPLKHPLPKRVHHKLRTDKRLLALVALVAILIIGGAVYWFGLKKDTADKTQVPNTVKATPKTATKKSTLPTVLTINGNTYLSSVTTLPDLHLFTDETITNAAQFDGISYYKIGTTKAGQIIVVATYSDGPGRNQIFFLGDPTSGSYTSLLRMQPGYSGYADTTLDATVKQDKVTKLTDVNFPLNATVANQKLSTKNYQNETQLGLGDADLMVGGLPSIRGRSIGADKTVSPQKIADKDGLTYYRVIMGDSPLFQSEEIYAVFNNIFSMRYDPAGEISGATDKIAIKWTAGENNSSIYFSGGTGCGNFGYVTASNINPSDLVNVGKSPQGQAIYQLPSSNALVQEIFDKDYSGGQYLTDDSLKNLNIQQMTDKHAYFIAKNGFGENVLFQRDDLFVRGGCAKPVVYLYPEKTTKVSVKVGAQVLKSNPQYTKNGWQNVTAQPNGQLTYNGGKYPNLFWEGYGDGIYPDINSGTIVKTTDLAATVKLQLAQQGLNANEIKDFMDYWSPKLSSVNQPYARVTWLNTSQMNRLAPLNIQPAPRTTIRVFLDFEGLDKQYDLPAQKLSTTQRLGFTVVEWGGLLRNGLN